MEVSATVQFIMATDSNLWPHSCWAFRADAVSTVRVSTFNHFLHLLLLLLLPVLLLLLPVLLLVLLLHRWGSTAVNGQPQLDLDPGDAHGEDTAACAARRRNQCSTRNHNPEVKPRAFQLQQL